jgi:hypothetical protein
MCPNDQPVALIQTPKSFRQSLLFNERKMRGEILNLPHRENRPYEKSKECPRNGTTFEIAHSL